MNAQHQDVVNRLTKSVTMLAERATALQNEHSQVEARFAAELDQAKEALHHTQAQLETAEQTISDLRAELLEKEKALSAAKTKPFSDLLISHDERLLIRQQLQRVLEHVEFELQRLA
jgi:uncharacterized phage infection (PIP) family protein YhgE